jgi:SpoVK/Ycf46/Vps4 family AAA+-type ATPase
VTSGELGTTVRDMETNLRKAFSIAKEWNAILLLDEADVFMSKRSADNLEKNAFVSVFLRLIEYYRKCLFLRPPLKSQSSASAR